MSSTTSSPRDAGREEVQPYPQGTAWDFRVLDEVLSAVPSLVMIVNVDREIVYANRAMLDFLGTSLSDLTGKAPGAALGCLHALEDDHACGSTPFSAYCGASHAMQAALQGLTTIQECHIVRATEMDPPGLNLRLWTTPIVLNDEPFLMMAAVDISAEKRHQALERIFFHDILNTATIIDGTVKLLLSMGPGEDTGHVENLLNQVAERLIDEILTQRDFVELESRQLTRKADRIAVLPFLRGLVDSYLSHGVTGDRDIRIDPTSPEIDLVIDKVLLGRVLGNLLKNAIEASTDGEVITLGCQMDGDERVGFWIHNDRVMPEEVRLQIFKRAFSTKGRGRGLGTYSARLLTERYLEGEITFTSEPGDGTTFRVRYPLVPSYADGSDGAGDAS